MLKLVILLVVFYFIARSVGNMMQAVLHDPKAPPPVRPPRRQQDPEWKGPVQGSAHQRDTDIEDAKWIDLD